MVPEPEQCRLFEFKGGDGSFLRDAGIRPCVIRGRRPRPLPLSCPPSRAACPTGKDTEWLRECGVAWEGKPAAQLPLDFSGCRKKEPDAGAPASLAKEESA